MSNHPEIYQTPILRLREFARWAQSQGLCESEYDFERRCGLSKQYISNNIGNTKGNIGTEMLGRVVSVFPTLNLVWICTGDGAMVLEASCDASLNADYKQAYKAAMLRIEVLHRIIKQLKTTTK